GGTSVALNNLGALLLVQQRPAEAMQAFQEALHLNPEYTRAAENLSAARALIPPPTIVNLPPYEASSAGNKRTEDMSFSQKIRESATPGPNVEAARRLAAVRLDPGVFQGRIDPADLKALLKSMEPVLTVPIAAPTEVPRFALELQ